MARQLTVLGQELRVARLTVGLTLAQVARAAGVTGQQVGRLERGQLRRFDAVTLARAMAAVGLDLAIRAYPGGVPIHDAGHIGLLGRLRERLAPAWRWHVEVPVTDPPDQRSWDALAATGRFVLAFEAETRLDDVQAQVRRILAKYSEGRADRVIIVLADTRHNRAVPREARPLLRADFPLDTRIVMAALRQGRDPGANGIVLL
ncbi:MAG TPA: helix-turn-helix transcriptional regulator [Candidatus Sulfotelmatobacter sp.]|nr:helix-turn-helix transcriptional regulator [Candidatus Sulfotelmatobacter sp.]